MPRALRSGGNPMKFVIVFPPDLAGNTSWVLVRGTTVERVGCVGERPDYGSAYDRAMQGTTSTLDGVQSFKHTVRDACEVDRSAL